jgi:hypothetical protein
MLPSKEYKHAGVMFIVFIIFLGAYFAYHEFSAKEPTVDYGMGKEGSYVIYLDFEKIDALKVYNDVEVLSFYNAEDRFVLDADIEGNWDGDEILDFIKLASKVPVDKKVERNVKDLSEFGLENPLRWLEFWIKDEAPVVLEVGDGTPRGDAYYVKIKGEDTLYITPSSYIERLFVSEM